MLKDYVVVTNGMIKLELLGGVKTEKEFRRLKYRLDALDEIEVDIFIWEIAYQTAFVCYTIEDFEVLLRLLSYSP